MPSPAPVEYAAAVDRYLGQAALGAASRRVYRISLVSWSWPLVGRPAPQGAGRRGAAPPSVPLSRLDDPGTGPALAAALHGRSAATDVRTVNRELSALRSAVAWWQDQRWISHDSTAGLRHLTGPPPPQPALTGPELTRLFQVAPTLRDHALWRVLHDSAAPAEEGLRLNVGSLMSGAGVPAGARRVVRNTGPSGRPAVNQRSNSVLAAPHSIHGPGQGGPARPRCRARSCARSPAGPGCPTGARRRSSPR